MLHARVLGDGMPVVFVHGFGASRNYWGHGFDELAAQWRLVFVDLAGFGRSLAVPGPYTIDGQVERLAECIRPLPGSPVFVGHSFGGVVAVRAAARWPDLTGGAAAGVMVFGLPATGSPEATRRRLASLGLAQRWMVTGSPWARATCWALCHLRPAARALAPYLAPDLPPAVARDAVQHTWRSAQEAFASLVDGAELRQWAAGCEADRIVVQGTADRIATPDEVRSVLEGAGVEVVEVPGDHHLPLRQPELCRELLASFLHRVEGGTARGTGRGP